MEKATDLKVKYSKSEYKTLYKWCLQEFSDDGKQVGGDYVPWVHRLYFRTEEIVYQISHSSTAIDDDEEIGRLGHNLKTEETICAKLSPTGRSDSPPRYKMMGFERTVEEMSLRVVRFEGDSTCNCEAMPQSTGGVTFHEETYPDHLFFEVSLNAEIFDAISQLIKSNFLDELQFWVFGVDGFYANWSPDIYTREIKILSSWDEHDLELPDNLEREPRRTGKVYEFHLLARSSTDVVETEDRS